MAFEAGWLIEAVVAIQCEEQGVEVCALASASLRTLSISLAIGLL